MTVGPPPICMACKHLTVDMDCAAFPDGIPEAIIHSAADHRRAYTGDHGIQFEQDERMPTPDFAFLFRFIDATPPSAPAAKSAVEQAEDVLTALRKGTLTLRDLWKRGYVRDAHGRFSRTGGTGGGGDEKPAAHPPRKSPKAALHEHILKLAHERVDIANANAARIVDTVEGIANKHGVGMLGFEYHIKVPPGKPVTRVTEKIMEDYTKAKFKRQHMTLEMAAAKQNDLVRFTFNTGEETGRAYHDKTRAIANEMGLTRRKNFWAKPGPGGYVGYQGFSALNAGPVGHYEVQFHTKQSFRAKMLAHEDFGNWRKAKRITDKRRLDKKMHQFFDPVKTPPGARDLD